eukprot:TRINITY_DN39098_c0_g1_i1.p1 TRINITY_DN39098_c0_g1~~TRINITY_DN39098_c0_g1_i1.p1  ORF type:complete len:537 (+),score=104.54 TRINITY_DN39098_c0_g1_i1:105-1613(+)
MVNVDAGNVDQQQMWNEFMRRPEAREAYQSDLRLQMKKSAWLAERREIEERGVQRKIIADALEVAPADIKKLIAPMFHIRIVDQFLWMLYDECQKFQQNHLLESLPVKELFVQKLREDSTLTQLQKLREQFHEGGTERMESLENQFYGICTTMVEDQEKQKEEKPKPIDVHTLKEVLEFAQECKRLGNEKFKEAAYEEALHIYSQGDEVMKKWYVQKHLKNESKWLNDYHLACLKNKAQAALKLELFATALEAADAALALDGEDHKAWYRKVQAEKCLGRFEEAEESLNRLEDVAQWCPDRLSILRDCKAERKRIQDAVVKHQQGTQEMLGKALETGVFSAERDKEEQEKNARKAAALQAERDQEKARRAVEQQAPPKKLERSITLTAALAGELLDELADSYEQKWYQERVQKCGRDSRGDKWVFLSRLRDIAFEVQKPILEKWGFDGTAQGVREMQAAIRDHAQSKGGGLPADLKRKQERCLELLYGGRENGGMAEIMAGA